MIVTKLTVINLNPFSDLYFSSQISVNQPLMTKKTKTALCLLPPFKIWGLGYCQNWCWFWPYTNLEGGQKQCGMLRMISKTPCFSIDSGKWSKRTWCVHWQARDTNFCCKSQHKAMSLRGVACCVACRRAKMEAFLSYILLSHDAPRCLLLTETFHRDSRVYVLIVLAESNFVPMFGGRMANDVRQGSEGINAKIFGC